MKKSLIIVFLLAALVFLASCAGENDLPADSQPDSMSDSQTTDAKTDETGKFAAYKEKDNGVINKDTINFYCNTNENQLKKGRRVVGLVLEFPGLDGNSCLGGSMSRGDYNSEFAKKCGAKGIVVAYMFPGPWSWMNEGAVRTTDLVVDAFMDKYGWETEEDFGLVTMGGSMGGQASLIYSIDSRHTVDACIAHCPCYNVIDSFDISPDFPRTFIAAIDGYDMPLEDALKKISPIHRINEMKKIPYFVCGDELDEVFFIDGMEDFVDDMKDAGLDVTFYRLAGLTHGGIGKTERDLMDAFAIKYADNDVD